MFRLLLLLLPLLSLLPSSRADLVWEKPSQEINGPPPGAEVRVPFAFRNTGAAPVHIESINTSCACLRTEISKHLVQPGERGVLSAFVRTIGSPASRTARIEIVTAEAPSRHIRLQLHIQQNTPATLEPAVLWWEINAPLTEKRAVFRVQKGTSVKLTPPTAGANFSARLDGSPGDEVFRVEVTPLNTKAAAEEHLTLDYTLPNSEKTESRTLFLRVQ